MIIESKKNLKQFNTFGLSAVANSFIELDSKKQATEYFTKNEMTEPFLILGGGSNILLTKDFDGLIIKNNLRGIQTLVDSEDQITLEVGAGENWHEFVLFCVDKGYGGIENLSLIPGNVGASPMQNIGAYGVEVKDVISTVEAIEISSGKTKIFTKEQCEFDYRSSIFKTRLKNQFFISSVTFVLQKKPVFKISYGAIKEQLEMDGVTEGTLDIKSVSNAVIKIRESKLPDPKKIGNSGSFFKNPIVSAKQKDELIAEYPEMPFYELNEEKVKLAAGWLIEKAGWKGYRNGDAGVHQRQALVLVNYGSASGSDIYALSEKILQSVKNMFKVELEREVNIV